MESVQQFAALTQHGTCRQWIRWPREQVSSVADRMEKEQRQRGSQLTTTKELEKTRAQIWGLEEELTRAKEYAAIMANMGQNTSIDTKPVASANMQNAPLEPEAAPVVNAVPVNGTEQAQEILTLKDELAAQEALREKEREQKKTAEEERWRIEENL